MKEFYTKANALLKIRRTNPVVTRVQREDELGEVHTFEEKSAVDHNIAKYFTDIYKRPDYRRLAPSQIDFNVEDDAEVQINTVSRTNVTPFTMDEVNEAVKSSNFNKGLGPDCFDGNVLRSNNQLNEKVITEITGALNNSSIPEYLRVGRLVPLQKSQTKGAVRLDDIRPIVVRSHLSKIMEKAILTKINSCCPHLIKSKVYQTGFKEGKSTAIHASRLLNEVHGNKKRNFYLLVDLQKAYDSVDREILWEILEKRCKNDGEKAMVKLMMKLHRESTIQVGEHEINAEMGLP